MQPNSLMLHPIPSTRFHFLVAIAAAGLVLSGCQSRPAASSASSASADADSSSILYQPMRNAGLSDAERFDVWKQQQEELRQAEIEKRRLLGQIPSFETAAPAAVESRPATPVSRPKASAASRYSPGVSAEMQAKLEEIQDEVKYCSGKVRNADHALRQARLDRDRSATGKWEREKNAWEQRLEAAEAELRKLEKNAVLPRRR